MGKTLISSLKGSHAVKEKLVPLQILRAICKNHNCPRPADTGNADIHLEPAQGRPRAAASAKPPKSS